MKPETHTGCYLDGNRGHYITRDAIRLAMGYGYKPDKHIRGSSKMENFSICLIHGGQKRSKNQ